MIVSNVMDNIPEVFNHENELEDNLEYVKILGRENNKRKYMYLKREFVIDNPYIDTFNVTLPESNGSGKFGEKLRSEEHTSELQSRFDLVCRLLLEKKKNYRIHHLIRGWDGP